MVTLRQQAETIWRAGVDAVDSARLVVQSLRRDQDWLQISGEAISLAGMNRIVVVGAGKAGAGMAAGVEQALGSDIVESKVVGWINVPSDCVRPLTRIHLHGARPPGVNEPTAEGVYGCERILELVESLTDNDLCLVLISGGGSALLPAPIQGITLADKLAVTRTLMRSGATIQQLNTVRKRLSRVKGGGLLRAAPAGRMRALVISDVVHDPLDIIASGPTVCDHGTARDALQVLTAIVGRDAPESAIPNVVWRVLDAQAKGTNAPIQPRISCKNLIIGNNETALFASIEQAKSLGFDVQNLGSNRQGVASEIGVELAERCLSAARHPVSQARCFIGGGEPTVKLAHTDKPRRGGRNQEVALAAGCRWMRESKPIQNMIVLSGGTDGEDGPTDAAGACFDSTTQQQAIAQDLSPAEFLAINDSYTFFDQVGGLIKTGPTHTNVMDLQIALVAGASS
ncbi:glycerate kinase type-2 family protein [Schlesneria paludicola]|uniref:glycerate kinase type-2 family protein n=1 Tax=Schlesneria paludicola TaxID=360056 RepID=UPI00029A9FE7|nr:DUF4147 domain-containing protein [Schlesneria paludicola]